MSSVRAEQTPYLSKPPEVDFDPLERPSKTPGFTLRCRMRKSLHDRLVAIAQHDRKQNDGWTTSDTVREALRNYCEQREAEIRIARAADFSGRMPRGVSS